MVNNITLYTMMILMLNNLALFVIVVYNVLPSSHCLVQFDTGRKFIQLREFSAILFKNQFKCIFKSARIESYWNARVNRCNY